MYIHTQTHTQIHAHKNLAIKSSISVTCLHVAYVISMTYQWHINPNVNLAIKHSTHLCRHRCSQGYNPCNCQGLYIIDTQVSFIRSIVQKRPDYCAKETWLSGGPTNRCHSTQVGITAVPSSAHAPHTYTHTYTHTHTHTRTHTRPHTYTYTYIHTHKHI